MHKNNIILLILISLFILVHVYNVSFSFKSEKLTNLTFGLLYGGILGNLIDRVFYGYVRDFIKIGNHPIFNIPDIAIVIGIILLMFICIKGEFISKRGEKDENKTRRREVIIINKPSGTIVHPGDGNFSGTLVILDQV